MRGTPAELSRLERKGQGKAAVAAEESGGEESPRDKAWMAHGQLEKSAKGWLVDSGATRHMTPQREFFVKFHPWDGGVDFRNSGKLPVPGRGALIPGEHPLTPLSLGGNPTLFPSFRRKSSHSIISQASKA